MVLLSRIARLETSLECRVLSVFYIFLSFVRPNNPEEDRHPSSLPLSLGAHWTPGHGWIVAPAAQGDGQVAIRRDDLSIKIDSIPLSVTRPLCIARCEI